MILIAVVFKNAEYKRYTVSTLYASTFVVGI